MFICDGEKDTCLSCPLQACIREFCVAEGKFITVKVNRAREERRAYEREYYRAHREKRLEQIKRSQRKRLQHISD